MRNIMNSYKRIVVLCFFAIIVFFIDNRFVYALEEVNLLSIDSIYVDTSNVKKNYVEGEDFDSSNMEVYAYYNDGSVGEINNYNIINGINLQRDINSVVIRIDKFIVEICVTVIPKDSVVTLSFKSKNIYDATLRKIRELEDILIDFNDEDMVITLYKDGLDRITSIEIESDNIDSLSDIKQLKNLNSIVINGKYFDNLEGIYENKGDLIDVTLLNNEKLTTVDKNIFSSLTLRNTNVIDVNNLSSLKQLIYDGRNDLKMDKLLDNLSSINVHITKNIDDIDRDDEGNIVLPDIFKEFANRGCSFEVVVYDQNSYYKYDIVTLKDDKYIISMDKLMEINYDVENQYMEISVVDTDDKYLEFIYKYKITYRMFDYLEISNYIPITVEEGMAVDLSNLDVYKVYSNKDRELTNDFVYKKIVVDKGMDSIEISYSEDGVIGTINIPINVIEHSHEWGEWNTVREATIYEEGQKERLCLKNNNHKEIAFVDKIPLVEYRIISGDNQIINRFDNRNLVVVLSDNDQVISNIFIDNVLISFDNYIINDNIITILSSYLSTLGVGEHIMEVVYQNGNRVLILFKIIDIGLRENICNRRNVIYFEDNVINSNVISNDGNVVFDKKVYKNNGRPENSATIRKLKVNVLDILIVIFLGGLMLFLFRRENRE